VKRVLNGSTRVQEQPTPANLTYYIVLLISVLAGLVAYNSGSGIEGSLMRAGLVLLACTVIGYLLNVVLWLASRHQGLVPRETATSPSAQSVGTRLNLVAGEDEPLDERSFTSAGGQASR